ncbi:hypothetical protein H0H93_014070, partial [Arthromyces matolae]
TERDMVKVCEGQMSKVEMLQNTIEKYKEMYVITKREFEKVTSRVRHYLDNAANAAEQGNNRGRRADDGGDGGGGGGNESDDDDNGGPGHGGGRGRGGGGGGGGGRGRGRGASRGRGNSAAPRPRSTRGEGTVPAPNGKGLDPPTGAAVQGGISSARQNGPPVLNRALTEPSRGRQMAPANPISSSSRPPPPLQPYTSGMLCDCGVPAAQNIHVSESASKGKKYWECASDLCGFYRRDNPPPVPSPPSVPFKRSFSGVACCLFLLISHHL